MAVKRTYSLSWARKVVKELHEKYPRAAEILWNDTQFTYSVFCTSLADNDGSWHLLRDCTAYLGRWLVREPREAEIRVLVREWTTHMLSSEMPEFDGIPSNGKNFLLTELREWLRLNSRGFVGLLRGAKAPSNPISIDPYEKKYW